MFVKDTLSSLDDGDCSDDTFNKVFAGFDKDGSGEVDKEEMYEFMRQLLFAKN